MAKLVGGICTSHIPAIGNAIARGLEHDPYWQPFFAGYPPVRDWLERTKPDVAVVVYNDHGLNFFLDNLPTFAIGAAPEYHNADEGWGLPTLAPYPGDPQFSWHIIESLVAEEFDVATCQEMKVDHAFTVPHALLWPGHRRPVKSVPVAVNTVQHPLPTAARCLKLGHALGRAIASYPENARVVVIATGGLSHQLDGERAGFINKEFDLMCLEQLVSHPLALTRYSIHDLVRLAGTQGVEVIMWLVMRGAMAARVREVHRHYHIPVSNTAAGLLLLENAA
ncbi:MAG TPA: class III extradiol dioxygenase family protein [Gammaproteobacteria bacterium]|nr:class III extradiol dioxygenase family protein [Gammaproteobacteria bacterium]